MRISETADCLTLRDVPMGIWSLGMAFVASGAFLLTIPFWSRDWLQFSAWERAAVIVIGAGHLAGGAYTMLKAAATRTEFHRGRGIGRHTVRLAWWLRTRQAQFSLADARAVEIVRTSDNDGDPIFQLRLWLAGSRHVWLVAQPVRGEGRVREHAERIRRFLGLATLAR